MFINGTFQCVLTPFARCATSAVTSCYVPVVNSLATARSHTTYWNILHFVVMATDHLLEPESITGDYETVLIAAIRDQLSNAIINGCPLHWRQAIRRRMKTLRISDAEASFDMERGAIDMLTVIPVEQVSTLAKYDDAKCRTPTTKWTSFWTYFGRTLLVTYSFELWNVHDIHHAVINNERTFPSNNPQERFNMKLNARSPTPLPSLPIFISTIERISRMRVEFIENVLARRAIPPRHPRTTNQFQFYSPNSPQLCTKDHQPAVINFQLLAASCRESEKMHSIHRGRTTMNQASAQYCSW